MPFIYKTDDILVNNSHQDNVKAYYSANKGHFYKECLDSGFTHNWPMINEPNKYLNVYSNMYDMGCRRSKNYNAYHKQFEFFCPLWLEHLSEELSFKINIKSTDSDVVLASNTLKLSLNGQSFHDRFIQYFNNYINDCKINVGNDNLLNIKFNNNTAKVTGLNVNTGLFETRSVDTLINNLISRERPLLEADNLLIQSFVNNSLICNQLFNFNLCFNINDILSGSITNMLLGEDVFISVDVFVGDKQIAKKDFYTDYEYIDKTITSDKKIDFSENVLNYLHDNECIDLIDKNKFCQSICHWSLCENTNYIFNVYDGFSGLFVENNENSLEYKYNIYENSHQYGNAPNTLIKKSDKNQNSTGWCVTKEIYSWNDFYKYIQNTNKNKTDGTYIYKDNFINNIKYEYIPNFVTSVSNESPGAYILNLVVPKKLLMSIINSFECVEIYNNSLYFLYKEDLLILLSSDINNVAFGSFYDKLDYFMSNNVENNTTYITYLRELYKMLSSKVDPSIITFNSSILYNNAPSPSNDSTEVAYYKDNNMFNYVMRYDGRIKPAFTDYHSTLYYKDYVCTQLNNSVYSTYGNCGYEPLYPSINFCAIKKLKDWTYENLPVVKVTEYSNPVNIYNTLFEYSWFNNNKCIILNDEIHFTYINQKQSNGLYKELDDIVKECISTYYNTNDPELIDYISSKYEYTNHWEYYSITNVDDYKYSITLKLK